MKHSMIILALCLIACNSNKSDQAYNMEGNHISASANIPVISHTIWTAKTELFVEFPALIVGNTSRFAAHFTMLDGHRPVKEGKVTVRLIKENDGISQETDTPASPGLFIPSLEPEETGTYQLAFELRSPAFEDHIVIEDVQVYESLEQAVAAAGDGGESGSEISFLKEQAWKTGFQTAPVTQGEVYEVVHSFGRWEVPPGDHTSIAASANGVVRYAADRLTAGMPVKKGQLLMTISSKGLTAGNLQADIQKARANYEQLKAEYDRKKELYAAQIVPKSEFEQVESKFLIAQSNYQTLSAGYTSGGKQIRAPYNGFVKSVNAGNGVYVEQGAALIVVGTAHSHILETQLSPTHNPSVESIRNIWYKGKDGEWSDIRSSGGTMLSVGKKVDTQKPMVSVYAEVNTATDMPEGSFTEVQIALGTATQSLLVEESALLEDYGNYSVMVQLSGETFERRPVILGKRNGKHAEVLDGLSPGAVVVTKGAYQLKMASMSGSIPGHGHEH